MDKRLKVYLETSFVSYLTGRPTTREPIASWQAASRQWWAAVAPSCDLFVSDYVQEEAQQGNADQVVQRMEVLRGIPNLVVKETRIGEIAKMLIQEHALPENETMDAYHIATAAFFDMDVLLTWNCKHIANEFTLPKTYLLLNKMGVKPPVIITPKRFMEDGNYDV